MLLLLESSAQLLACPFGAPPLPLPVEVAFVMDAPWILAPHAMPDAMRAVLVLGWCLHTSNDGCQ